MMTIPTYDYDQRHWKTSSGDIYKVRVSEENITRNSGLIIFVTISFEWLLIKAQSLELV